MSIPHAIKVFFCKTIKKLEKMKTLKKLFFAVILVTFIIVGCKKENSSTITKKENSSVIAGLKSDNISYIQGDLILGQKLNNPYTISNMAASFDTLTAKGIISNVVPNIRPTHYYIKFTPVDIDEYEILKSDTTLVLYDYPLDYEIIQNGNRYHDPILPDSIPTYQYGVVKAGYTLNHNIAYEIISELYIPEVDSLLIGSNSSNMGYVDKLLDQAYIQTNNFSDTIKSVLDDNAKSFHPGGNILINDTRIDPNNNNIGMEGVEMRARRWYTTYYSRTDFYGNFRMSGSFKRPCNYSLHFDQRHFTVREHLFGFTAWINGPKISGDWKYTITNGYDRFVGHIFRGAFRYHYGIIDGLQRPYRPSGNRTIYIGIDGVRDWSGVNWIVFPIIKIARYRNGNIEYASDEIFSTTVHETAHTSHVIIMNAGTIQYSQVTTQLQESWPIGVEWWLTKLEYKYIRGIHSYGDWNYDVSVQYPNQYAYQYWNSTISHDYTPLFIDLTDSHNEFGQFYQGRPAGTVNDQVVGYTFYGIEKNVLKHSYGLTSLKTQLKNNKPSGVTDAQIDLLISYY